MGFTTLKIANLSVCIFISQVTAFGPRFPSDLTPPGNVVPSRLETSKVSTAIKSSEENVPLDPSPSAKTKQLYAQLPFFLTQPLTQVVSDIDDTLKSSGGVTIAGVSLGGIDVQYARGDFYPGVFQFMFELSLYSVLVNQRYYEEYLFERGSDAGVEWAMEAPLVPPKVAVLTGKHLLFHS